MGLNIAEVVRVVAISCANHLSGYLENLNHFDQFPITEHVHFFGFYIGNFPDLKIEDVDFICGVLNAA